MSSPVAHLVHTEEAAPVESTGSVGLSGSIDPGTRSSAGEHPLHTGRVAGSIPAASTIRFTFTDDATARDFLRLYGLTRGMGMDGTAEVCARATRLAARAKPEDLARAFRTIGAKKKHVSVFGQVRCQKCGARLSDPESVAAQLGPECMGGGR